MTQFQISNLKFLPAGRQGQISNGSTLIELILVMGIFSTLVGITLLSLLNILHKNSLAANVNVFTADLKQQQLRAMVGEGDSGSTTIYQRGVYLQATSYTLFRGSGYVSADANNFSVALSTNTQFTVPNSTILFEKGSGEIGSAATVTFKDINDNSQKAITINKYGVVTGIN